MFESIRGKRVLVTGGTGGIGSAIVQMFADHGARVGIHCHRNRAQAKTLQEALGREGRESECFEADLTQPAEAKRLMDRFVQRFQGIDVLINNAGAVSGTGGFQTLSEEDWDRTFALNVRAPFFLAQAALPHMRKQAQGRIINISSIAAKYGGAVNSLHYAASKAALETMTRGLARWCAPDGIQVSAIRGGFIETAFHEKMGQTDTQARIQQIPLKRPGHPMDIARTALFLASDGGNFITGEIVTVAGGD